MSLGEKIVDVSEKIDLAGVTFGGIMTGLTLYFPPAAGLFAEIDVLSGTSYSIKRGTLHGNNREK